MSQSSDPREPIYGSQPPYQPGPNGQAPYGQAPFGAPGYGQPPYGGPGYQPQPYEQPPVSESDERLWGALTHISIPFLGFLGPLIVFLVYKDRSPWLRAASTEALNFSITYTVAMFLAAMSTMLLIGFLLLPVAAIGGFVLCVLATIAASRHELYRYPANVRLIK